MTRNRSRSPDKELARDQGTGAQRWTRLGGPSWENARVSADATVLQYCCGNCDRSLTAAATVARRCEDGSVACDFCARRALPAVVHSQAPAGAASVVLWLECARCATHLCPDCQRDVASDPRCCKGPPIGFTVAPIAAVEVPTDAAASDTASSSPCYQFLDTV